MQREFEGIEKQILSNISHNPHLNDSIETKSSLLKLPEGNRRRRLEALIEESRGNLSHSIYPKTSLTTTVPPSTGTDQPKKDQTAIDPSLIKSHAMNMYSQGLLEESVTSLLQYLDFWMGDWEAHYTLSLIYTDLCMFKQARWALEECLLIKPDDHRVVLAYADLLSAMGEEEACGYYCMALEIVETGHGWYGVLGTAGDDDGELVKKAKERLKVIYGDASGTAGSSKSECADLAIRWLNKV